MPTSVMRLGIGLALLLPACTGQLIASDPVGPDDDERADGGDLVLDAAQIGLDGATDAGALDGGAADGGAADGGDCASEAEVCDGIDQDCDGRVDEGIEPRACGSDVGLCEMGVQACEGGAWGSCADPVAPSEEGCNGEDDDCDGSVDEGLMRACGSDVGRCSQGAQGCEAGVWGACMGATLPETEACNGADDDCDGRVDEGLVRDCPGGTETGRCDRGRQTCSAGAWGSCTGRVEPIAETCNDRDDDCDGRVDEGVTRACSTDTGRCVRGTQACSRGGWGSCSGITPRTERLDGRDDDCDGRVDEDFPCNESGPRLAMRHRTNDQRRARGLSNLRCNQLLIQVANAYAAELCRNYPAPLSHTDSMGRGPGARVRDAGGHFAAIGENLAMTPDPYTAAQTVTALMASPSHRNNILRPDWVYLGVGYQSCLANGQEFWVQLFAR